jgi:thiamine pyrophosphokinase
MEEARALSGGEPLIAAADSGLLLAEQAEIQSDWIVGDMDSLEAELKRLAAYPPEIILRYPPDKDYTDTELAFSLLREKGCECIWIIGGGGGRLDQLLGIRSLFERDDPPGRWITAADDIYCIDAVEYSAECGVSAVLQKRVGFHAPVAVFPLGVGPWEAESAGLKWPLAGLSWKRDFIAISNEAPGGDFTITALQGRFMVMSPIAIQ